MQLTDTQTDALTELINIGFGRAAASLSKLTGHRVSLEVPEVTMCPVLKLGEALRPYIDGEIATVHQVFSGPVAGDALLVLDHRSGAILKELLTDETALPLEIDASAREVIAEVGNILLNACLGVFGNLLKVQVSFSVPHVTLEAIEAVLQSLLVEREGLRYALVVHAGFKTKSSTVTGYLIIVLSVASVARLIESIDRWEAER
jgi:chemotaxis protein CheC